MSRPLITGSAVERIDRCPASAALPHVDEDTVWSERGTVIHRFMEDLAGSDRETALAAVPDDWRDVCGALDLSGLESLLSCPGGAEIAIAIDVTTWQARELGRGQGRAYQTVTESEIACTLDAVRVDVAKRRGLYAEYKSGYGRSLAEWQIKTGSLAVALLWDLVDVDAHQINVGTGAPWIRRAHFGRMDFAVIKSELADVHARAVARRAEYDAGKVPSEFAIGSWCQWCPARRVCPAQIAQIHGAITGTATLTLDREPLTPELVAALLPKVREARRSLHMIQAQLDAFAGGPDGPLSLGQDAAGNFHWYGTVVKPGVERLDGEITERIVAGLHGPEVAAKAIKKTATKKDLEAAVREIAPPRKCAAYVREALELIRAVPLGVSRRPSVTVDEFTTKSADRPAPPALPAPAAQDELKDGEA